MQFLIPDTKKKTKFLGSLTAKDLLFLIIGIALIALVLLSSMVVTVKIILCILIIVITFFSVITIDVQKGWRVVLNFLRFITRRRKWNAEDISGSLTIDEAICYNRGIYTTVIQLNGINFSILSEEAQNAKIVALMQIIQELRSGKIVKFEEPIDLTP